MGVILIDFNIAAAIDGELCMAAVGKEGIAIDLRIHIAIDGDLRSCLESIVTAAVHKRYAIVAIRTVLGSKSPGIVLIPHGCDVAIEGDVRVPRHIKAKGIVASMDQHVHIAVDGEFIWMIRILLALSSYPQCFDSSVIGGPDDQLIRRNGHPVYGIDFHRRYGLLTGTIGYKGQGMALRIDVNRMVHISHIDRIGSGDGGILGKHIMLPIILQNAGIHIFLVFFSHAGNGIGEFRIGLGFRKLDIVVEALTCGLCAISTVGEGNLTSLHFCRRCGKAGSNLYGPRQMAIGIAGVIELIGQLVQNVSHQGFIRFTVGVIESCIDSFAVRDELDLGSFFGLCDFKVTANDVFGIRFIMAVEDLRHSAVIKNSDGVGILLVNNTGVAAVAAAVEGCQLAALPDLLVFTKGSSGDMGLLFIGPGGPILEVQVHFTDIVHGVAAGSIVIVILVIGCYSGPEGAAVRKRYVQFTCISPVYQFAAGIFHHPLAILASGIHVAGNLCRVAAGLTIFHINIDSTFVHPGCIVIMIFFTVHGSRNGTAAYRNLCIGTGSFQGRSLNPGNIHISVHRNLGIVSNNTDSGGTDTHTPDIFPFHTGNGQWTIHMDFTVASIYRNAVGTVSSGGNIVDFHRPLKLET